MPAARTPPPLPILAVAALAGTGACLAWPTLPTVPAVVAALLGIVAMARRTLVPAVLLAAFAWTALHAGGSLSRQLPAVPAKHDVVVDGRIANLPRYEPRRVVFEFDVGPSDGRQLRGRRVRVSWYADGDAQLPVLRGGERWRLPLRLQAPRGLRNPGGADVERHAFGDRLAGTGYVRGDGARRLGPATGLAGWRDRTAVRIARAVSSETSRFVRALAIGDTRGLDDEDWAVLRANGLIHLIAISGFHVGMVAGAAAAGVRALWWLIPSLGRRCPARVAAAVVGTAVAASYAAAAGFSLPTLRTLAMIAVATAAIATRRSLSTVHSLALALMAILLADPLSVLSAGFWLSFAGVAWLLWCMPRGSAAPARDLVRAQAVATVGLLPLTVLLFGEASVAGPLANLVAVPLWSLCVAPLAVLGLALDGIHPAAAAISWRAAAGVFDVGWPLFETLAESPLALLRLPEPSAVAVPLALLGAFWLLLPRGTPGKALALLLWLPLLWPDTDRPHDGAFEVTVLDVGQGLSVVVRTREHDLLYDAGPAVPDGFDAGERAVAPALHALGIRRLDRLVVSHGDLDHAGGVEAVLRAVPASRMYAPAGGPVDGAACVAGQSWTWDGVRFEILHPPMSFPYLANESSCVLRIRGAHGSALLTGDIGDVIEDRLVARYGRALASDVVVVAHHGSRSSSSEGFVAATRARHALISAGHANRYRHPAPAVVERWRRHGADVHDTARSGALGVRLDADGITISERRRERRRLWDAAHRAAGGDRGLSYGRD